ncbi:class I SAM-dependent methyltransferase [Gordoniibacillus kamchatkensis]|uniref:class I SAM-dependent methyltransferase n=1 Tax=Gordoniibacillus kamchatkensis TaxID=1590651 RepID=UPI001E2CB22B|nr:class I SAM-dependent methyltransferase [Paenibacillus sp. VKM B-2647]
MTEPVHKSDREHWNDVFSELQLGKPVYDLWLDSYGQLLAGTKDDAVIDLGCGYGCDTLYLAERGYRVIACDLSEEALRRIHEHIPEAATTQVDMTAGLPFADGSAGAVVADLSLHYFAWDTTVRIVREIARVLKPAGLCWPALTRFATFTTAPGSALWWSRTIMSTKAGANGFSTRPTCGGCLRIGRSRRSRRRRCTVTASRNDAGSWLRSISEGNPLKSRSA